MIGVAVLEDNSVLQSRLLGILSAWEFVEKVYGAESNIEFSQLIDIFKVDVLLADLNLPDGCGTKSIGLFLEKNPKGIAIAISARSDSTSILGAIMAGAVGFLHKDDSSLGIINSIKMALAGESAVSPSVARTILEIFKNKSQIFPDHLFYAERNSGNRTDINGETPFASLTPRELEVLETISKGFGYREAAVILGISNTTLPVHVRKIYGKLRAKNRSEAIYKARNLGILK